MRKRKVTKRGWSKRRRNAARRHKALSAIGRHAALCKRGCKILLSGLASHLSFHCPTGMRLDKALQRPMSFYEREAEMREMAWTVTLRGSVLVYHGDGEFARAAMFGTFNEAARWRRRHGGTIKRVEVNVREVKASRR